MNPAWIGCFICVIMLYLIIYDRRKREKAIIYKIINSKRKEKGEKTEMIELAKKFIDKECIIYTFNYQINGVIKEVSDGAVLVDCKGTIEAINLDFITRIREYPRKKNGKKKSIVLD